MMLTLPVLLVSMLRDKLHLILSSTSGLFQRVGKAVIYILSAIDLELTLQLPSVTPIAFLSSNTQSTLRILAQRER